MFPLKGLGFLKTELSVMKDLKAHVEKGFALRGLSFLASPSIVTVTKSGLFKPLKLCQTVDLCRSQ